MSSIASSPARRDAFRPSVSGSGARAFGIALSSHPADAERIARFREAAAN